MTNLLFIVASCVKVLYNVHPLLLTRDSI